MADSQDNKNPLNDAVENIVSNDAATESTQAQERQNQQNTATSTVATGAETLQDDIAEGSAAPEEGSSGSSSDEGATSQGSSAAQSSDTVDSNDGAAQSNVVEGGDVSGESGDVASQGSGSSASAPQSVGGDSVESQSGGSEGDTSEGVAPASTGGVASGSAESTAAAEDGFDTETVSETFEVNVDGDARPVATSPEDDFDTETVSETFEVNVENVNDGPEAEDLAYTIEEDGSLTFTDAQLLAGATDIDGDDLSVESVSYTGADGVFTDNGDGTYTFAPNENFTGDVDVSFVVSDGTETTTANVDITVTEVNDPPVAGSTSYQVNEDSVITISNEQLLANSSDIEGEVAVDSVSYSGIDGIFTDNGDGTYSFAPNENFTGDVSLDVTVVDEDGATAETTAGIDVLPLNDLPVSGDLAYSVDEDGAITLSQEQLLSQASDVEGDDLSASNLTAGDNATVTENPDGSFTITPDANFNGDIDLSFDISDGTDSIVANADLTVNPVNDLPTAEDQAFTMNEDGTLTFTDEQLLQGSADIDGDDLTVESVSYTGSEGVLTDNGGGIYTFAPNENFSGDVDMSFTVSDGTDTVNANIDIAVGEVNDPPVAGSTSYQVNEDSVITISDEQLLANSSDIEGDVSVDSVSYSGTDGIFTDNGDGTYSFAPNENFTGDVSLDVTVVDEDGATADTTAGIDVLPLNDLPVSGDLAYSVDEDGAITISQEQLLSQASDVEGDALNASNLTAGDNATVTENPDGSFTITPDANFNGDIDLSFDISDGTDTVVANADLTVNPVNDLPTAEDQAFTMNEDGTLTFTDEQLLQGSADIDGDDLTVESVSYTGSEGVLTDNGDGTYTFAPNENFSGDVDMSFTVSDGTDTVNANIDIAVGEVNDPPVAGSTSYQVNEDSVITISDEQLLANSSDIEGDVAVDSVSYSGTNGIFTDNGDGTYSFAPNENFDGDVSLDVTVVDEDGATADTTAGIDVLPLNDVPVSGDLAYSVDEDGAITISQEQLLSQASDVEGDALTASNLTAGDNATVTENPDGSFTITPDANFNGDIDLSFDISDGTDTVVANADLTVNPVNDLPSAEDQAFTMNEDGTLTFTDEQLLQGSADIDGDDLTVESVSYTGSEGVLTDNGDGTYTFAPNENFSGDVDMSFTVSDGTDTVNANIDIAVGEVNDPPVAGSTSYQVNEDSVITISDEQLLANSSDIEGDVAVDSVSYSGTGGIFTDNGDGTYSFAPNENFTGDVSLDVTVVDEDGATADTTAGIDVLPLNDLPVSGDLAYSVDEDGAITISQEQLLSQASDVEGDALTASNLTAGDNATVTENPDGSFTITPDANFNGDIDLSFDISDGTDSIVASADLTVNPVNDLPSAEDQAFTMNEDGTLTFTDEQLLQGSADIDGDDLSVESVSYTGADGVFTDNGDGTYTFAPNENFTGDVDVSFVVSDGTETTTANVDITVTEVNDPPVAGSTSYQVNEDSVITISNEQLLANSSDVEGDVAVDSVSYSGTDGIFTDNGDGTYSFAPNENFTGDVSLDVTVIDEDGATAETTAGIDVLPLNDMPVSGDLAYSVDEDGAITLSQEQLLSQASDVEGDALTASNLTAGDNATVTENPDGSFTITPDANFNGDIDLSFDISDGTDTVVANADLTVNPVNDLPTAEDQAFTMNEDGTLTFTDEQLLQGSADIDGDDLSVESVSYTGSEGVLTDNGDGTYTFAPNENFSGDVDMSFTVSDGTDTVNANIDIAVGEVNDPPVAGSTSYQVNEDSVITISNEQLLANSSDIEGDVAVDSVSYLGTDGIFTDNGDGTYSFAPNENFTGDVSLDVTVVDEDGATADTTAGIDVLPLNDVPVSGDLAYSVNEDGAITISQEQLLSQASDVEGDALNASNLTAGDNATVTENPDGSFTITPDANFNGDIDLSFDISDGTDSIVASADLTVNPVNDLPTAEDQAFTMNEDGTLTFTDEQLLQGSADIEGDDLSVESVSYTGSEGVLTDNGDGTYTFAPNENFSGDVDMSFTVSDGTDTVNANIDIAVGEVNDPPVAGSTSYQVNEDSVITISDEQLLANSSDIEGDVAVDSVSYSGTDGIFTDNGDGTYSFAPNENFDGDVSLDVTVIDEDGATAETTAGIDVLPLNDVPVSGDLAYSVDEDGAITISQEQLLSQASDVEGDALTASNLSAGDNATVTENPDGSFTITPDANFNGDIDLSFDISDGTDSIVASADLTVNPVNDLPTAEDHAFTMNEDGSLTFTDEQLLQGTADIDGDDLIVESVSYTGSEGVLTDNGDGTYTFAPNENFSGDVDMSFTVSDGTDTVNANIDIAVGEVNDPPVAGSTSYQVNEDSVITISDEQLLANSSDIEGDVAVDSVSYSGTDGIFTDNGDGTYSFAPNENFNGDLALDVTVTDEDGATAETTAGITVIAVNDAPQTSDITAQVDEDNTITITQEELLANASDIDGDDLSAINLATNDPNASIVANEDGSFTITPAENFNGEVEFTFDITDGVDVVATELDLTVNPVNDAPDAGDEIYIQAEEDQTVGISLRDEPTLRLDQAPEFGIIEANVNDEWVELEVGVEIPVDTEVRFVPDEDAMMAGTHTTQIGTFDDNASVDDWGTEVDSHTREFVDGDLTVTVQSNDGPLGAWNGNTHIGHGIGDTDRQGLSGDEKLTISLEGQDINEISFHLDGLGGWFMESSKHFTEVEIKAFNDDGELIDSMTYHKEDKNSFETDYTLTVDQPVSYFELGTIQGNGTYVVQNMTVSQTCQDEAVFTSLGTDGTEITETVSLNIRQGDSEIDLSADLPSLETDQEGVTQFASVVITEEDLLAQATDIDSDDLDIENLALVGDNAEHATLTDNGDGTWTVTPDANFNGEIELGYQVTDGELTDDNIINISFDAVNDAPIVSGPIILSTDEDVGITFSADDLLANASDIEGDELSITEINYTGENGELVDNGDGTYTFMLNENFNGEIDVAYSVFDGTDTVETNIDLTVIPVNDVPEPGAPLQTQMLENGTIIIEAKDLLAGSSDVDGDILHLENLALVDPALGTLTDNGDNTFTFEPATDFYGEVNLTFDISDGMASVPSTAFIDVEIVNEAPEVSGPVNAVVDEDGTITLTQDELLANASDVDGDNLTVENLQTNDPNATVIENADGSFTITPSENFFGEIEFTYDVSDAIEVVASELNLTVNPVNDLPDVPDLSFSTQDGESITITQEQLLAQATDVEGDDLSVLNVTSQSDQVEVIDNGDGTFTLTPDQGYFGNADLTFDVSDGTDIVSADIDLKVEFVNDAPEADAISASVDEDGSILVTQEMLLENTSDMDGDELLATGLTTNDPNAIVVDNGDGTYSVTPSADFNGQIQFEYEVTDGELSTLTELNLDVLPVNDAPEAEDHAFTMNEDGTLTFTDEQLLQGSADIDGDDLSVESVSYTGSEGVLTDNGDGTYTFAPNENFSGDVDMSFTVSDGTDTVNANIDIAVDEVNDPPVAGSTAYQVNEDGVITISDEQLLANSSDVEGGVAVDGVSYSGSDGIFTDNGDGTYSFAPNENFDGDVSLDVSVIDEDGATAQTTAGIDVIAVNDAPVSGDLAYSVDEDGAITLSQEQLLSQASDVDGDDLTASNLSAGHNATVIENPDGSFEIIPDANFNGDIDLSFDISDGTDSIIASADLTVNPVNDLPTAEDQAFTMNEDGTLTFTDEQLLQGSADIDGDDLTIESVSYTGSEGVLTDNGDGTYTFAPNENFSGDVDMSFTVSDGTDTVNANIDIAVGEVNDPPVAGSTSYQVNEDNVVTISDEQLLANSSDVEGDVAVDSVSYSGTDGIFTDNGDGTYSFAPNENFNGDVSFDVTVVDEDGATAQTTANVDVIEVNDPPIAGQTSYTINEDSVLTFNESQVLANASDIEGDVELVGISYDGPDGIFSVNGDGTCSFAPNENFNGEVQLNVTIQDEDGATVDTVINVDVLPINDAPVSGDLAYSVDEDGSITLTQDQLLSQASDVEGDALTASNLSAGDNATVTENPDGSFTITPDANFNGDIDLSFDISDGTDSIVASADLTVNPVNDLPTAEDQAFTMNEDGTLTFTDEQLLQGSADIDGDDLTVESVSYTGSEGVLTDNGDGTYTFAPNENFSGDVDMSFTVSDGTDTVNANIDIAVGEVNDPPVAGSTSYQVNEDSVITISNEQLLANSSDVEGDVAVDSVSYSGTDGIFTDNGDGTYSFAPNENFDGDVSLDVTVIDEDGATADTTAGIDVLPLNDVPVSGDLAYSVDEDGAITISQEQLLSQASDVEGDALTASNLSAGDNATVTENPDGSFTITPDANFNGDIDLSFEISDGTDTVVANADLTVNPVNDLPTAEDQAFTMNEDGTLTFTDEQLLQGSADIDGDDLTIESVSYTGSEGVLTDNGDGTYTFAPNENFSGDVDMSFTVSDGTDTVNANIDIAVGEVNDPPVAGSTSYSMQEDGVITLSEAQLIANSSDIEGEVSLESVTYTGGDGELVDNGDGTFSFTPNANFNGDIALDVTVVDEDGATAQTTADIDVIPVNDAPETTPVSATVAEDGSITVTQEELLANASDIEGDDLTALNLKTSDPNATVAQNDDGSFTITPSENFNGDIAFTYDVSDGENVVATELNLEVTPVNDLPTAPTLSLQGEEDQVLVIDPEFIVSQSEDLDGDDISLTNLSVRQPQGATLQVQPDGMYHLVTTQDFNGLVELAYQLTDGTDTVDGSLNVNMIPVNDAPFTEGNAHLTTSEDGAFTFTADDMLNLFGDVDTENLVVSRVIMPDGEDGGDLTDNGDGTFTFTPSGDFAGTSGLQVVVSDGEEETTLEVPVYVRPVADGAVITTDHDGPLVFSEDSTGHLGLNVDLLDDSEVLSNLVMTGFPVGFVVSDGVNTVEITQEGQYIDIDDWDIGDLQLTPPEDFSGNFFITVTATTVDYGDESSSDLTEPSAVYADFKVEEGESIILTADDLLEMAENTEVQEGDEIQFAHLMDESQGELIDNGDGTWTFNPADGFTGNVDFAYVINRDGELIDEQSSIGVLTSDEMPEGNSAPHVTGIGQAEVDAGESIQFTADELLSQVSDLDGDEVSLESIQIISGQGLLEQDADGTYTFTPAEGFSGQVELGFVATDGTDSVRSLVEINVNDVQPSLQPDDDGAVMVSREAVSAQMDLSESDVISEIDYSGDQGTLIDTDDDNWTFWPDDDFNGELPLDVSVNDQAPQTVTMSVDMPDDNQNAEPDNVVSIDAASEVNVTPDDVVVDEANSDTTDASEDSVDITAAPNGSATISLPDEVTSNPEVESVEVTGLPEGSEVSGALEVDGAYIVSGDLSQPLTVNFGESFQGTTDIEFTGLDSTDVAVDGAQSSLTLEVDESHEMSASSSASKSNVDMNSDQTDSNSDWTQADQSDMGIDVMDDSSSFDSDSSNQQNIDPMSGDDNW
uniref:tandem-95 repeat protein n=1 Tax=Thaumasiovibrio occultus TaxID=1891184 RepID=UPI000B35E493|nr:tandem-95 repeat protein [Thaumasiovibrio occultus]